MVNYYDIIVTMYFKTLQGVQCKDCRYNAHKKCSERVPRDCTGEVPQVIINMMENYKIVYCLYKARLTNL